MEETRVISIDGVIYAVDSVPLEDSKKLEKDRVYVHGERCYIYGGKIKEETEPGYFYKIGNGKYTFLEPSEVDCNLVERICNVGELKEALVQPPEKFKEIPDDNANETGDLNIFAPPIKECDDVLKKMVKSILREAKVDLKKVMGACSHTYDLTNMKAAITKESDLSIKYFLRWMEILEADCTITVGIPGNGKISHVEPITMRMH